EGRRAARRRRGRKPSRVPPATRGPRGAGADRGGAARPASARRGDGGGRGVRSLQGLSLHLVPQFVELVESNVADVHAALLGEPLDCLEPPLEFVVRPLERRAGVDRQLTREVDDGKEKIADLILQGVTHPAYRIPPLAFEVPHPLF